MLKYKNAYLKFVKKQEVPEHRFQDKIEQLDNFYLPICNKLFNYHKYKKKTLLVGLSGGQGSGKSTIAKILKIILKNHFMLNVVNFSIDDFYKTIDQRKKMAKSIHPLFSIRGVPGTHDTKMIYYTIKNLMKKKFKKISIPRFDKSSDERFSKKNWQKITKRPDIIIFEGWCVGANHELITKLSNPVNILEKKEDGKLTWRKKVNNELKTKYKKIFSLIDKKIFLKIPNFKYVLKWRLIQEKKLRKKFKKKTMTSLEVKKFIMLYERITKNMIKNYKSNDIILFIDKKHKIKSMENR